MSDTDDTDDDKEAESEINGKEITEDISVNKKVSSITRNLHNLSIVESIVSPSTSVCKFNECVREKNRFMLECKKCKRLTHYACTGLPDYQISLFMQPRYSLYICENCVGVIHSDISDNCSTYIKELKNKCVKLCESNEQGSGAINDDLDKPIIEKKSRCTQTTATWKSNEDLMKENKNKESELVITNDEIQRVKDEKTKQRNDILHLKQKITTTEYHAEVLRKTIKNKESSIDSMKNEMDSMKNEILNLREESNKSIGESQIDENNNTASLNKKFEKLSNTIIERVTKIVDDKLNIIDTKFQNLINIPDKISESCKTFKNVLTENVPSTGNNSDFRQIMRETRNEELLQQKERAIRAHNLIIHGFSESTDRQKETDVDNEIIKELFGVIEIESTHVSATRIGKPSDTKSRPLKVIMRNLNDKELVMNNLNKLKNAEDRFRKISITDDYTNEEREAIRIKVTEAKNKTEVEGGESFIWKVRGSPKNGLRLVRFTKKNMTGANPN